MKIFDVAALGSGNIDLIFSVPRLPKNDDKVVGKKIAEQIGGTAANSACVMGNLGLKVTSISSVGDNHYAQAIMDDFVRYNVDTQYVSHIPGMDANMAIIFLDQTGEKSLVYAPNEESESNLTHGYTAIEQSRALYTMPGKLEKFRHFADYARKHGTKVIVDIESHVADNKETLNDILSLTNIAFFNQDGYTASCQCEPTEENMRALLELHSLDVLIVTRGAAGVIAVTSDECAEHSGFKVPVVDTTGAGDTFNAAFIFAHLNAYSLAKSVEFAGAAAALNISHLGARGHLSDVPEIENFIKTNS